MIGFVVGEGLYESSRAVNMVDSLPRAPSYFGKKRIAFSPRFACLLSYKVLLFERRWISVSTSQIDKVQKVWKSSSERHFLENGAHFQNLKPSESRATEFSWTSRSYHRNRYISKPTWEGFRADLTTGGRAISIFVKIFLEKAHSIFATSYPPIVL